MLFDPTAPAASYDFFEVDAAGNFLPLQVNAPAGAGMFTQFQIDGKPVSALAAAKLAEQFAMSSVRAAARPALTAAAVAGPTAKAGKRPGTPKAKKTPSKQRSRSGKTARGRR